MATPTNSRDGDSGNQAAPADGRRQAAREAAVRMGTAGEQQHLSADQPNLDRVDAASADSFPSSDPPSPSHVD